MTEKIVSVSSSLDSRSAAMFVQTAGKYQSSTKLTISEKTVNAKSIMGIISLGILGGHVVKITAEGPDENEAINELSKFLTK